MIKQDKGRQGEDQLCVVVRVDVVIYVLVAVIALLAIFSIVVPERVDLTLVSSLGTLLAGVLGGWLTYMRLSKHENGDNDSEAGKADAPNGG